MDVSDKVEGLREALHSLDHVDNGIRAGMRRALYRIGALVKKTAVDYAPISPTTAMLRAFRRRVQAGGADALKMYVPGRKGRSGSVVTLTNWYLFRLDAFLAKGSTTRPKPGGLMRSIAFRSTDTIAEVFVPANSPAGKYAAKIHDERGSSWKDLGPGSQAKGPQAREKFIERAVVDNQRPILQIVQDEIDRAVRRTGGTS